MSEANADWKAGLKSCKTCGKSGQFDFCSKDCIEKYKQSQEEHSKAHIEYSKETSNKENPFTEGLRDGAFQKGIHWRRCKLEAIFKTRNSGVSDEQILRQLRIGGITIQKARELMRDSEELLGR